MNELSVTLFEQIRGLVAETRTHAVRAVNRAMIELYWQIGRLIVEHEQGGAARAQYGKGIIGELAQRLTLEFGKGFDESNLRNMRRFYLAFPIQDALRPKLPEQLRPELSWTHYRLLLRITDPAVRAWYMHEAATANWSARALERQLDSHYYERLLSSQDRQAVVAEAESNTRSLAVQPKDALKDPYIFEFLGLPAGTILERDLEAALLDNLQMFLLELGRGFSFVSRQYRVSTETADFFIDLVFYHFRLKCFVLIDLKTGALTHQDIGQMDMYVRLFNDRVREANDNPTIGLILCAHKDETIVHYSALNENPQLFASEYRLYLPTEAELKAELERERALLRQQIAEAQEQDQP